MSESLDYPLLETLCWRALCRHHVSEREMVISATIIRLSFVIGEPCLRLDRANELAELTGMSKGNAHDVVQRLTVSRAIEVSADRRVYTFLPPSPQWPWIFKQRVNPQLADEREHGIIWACKGPQQAGFYFHRPEAGQEFSEALAVERMRASLMEYHRAATARGADTFSVTDRLPKPAPASTPDKGGEGLSRPLGTAGRGDHSSAESVSDDPNRRVESAPAADADGSRKRNPVPESGTAHLSDLSVLVFSVPSKQTGNIESLSAFNAEFPNREPGSLPPDAGEEQIVKRLRSLMGTDAMAHWGGWWRLRVREDRRSVIDAVWDCETRITEGKPPRNPGPWMKDRFNRYHRAVARAQTSNPPT